MAIRSGLMGVLLLRSTKLGRFGTTSISHLAPMTVEEYSAFCSTVGVDSTETSLFAATGDRLAPAVGTLRLFAPTGADDEQLLVSFSVEDADATQEGPPGTPVEFDRAMAALAEYLPGKRSLACRGQIEVPLSDATPRFAVPLELWRDNPPFGRLQGVRFALEARGS